MLDLLLNSPDILLHQPDDLLLLLNSEVIALEDQRKDACRQVFHLVEVEEVFEVAAEGFL